MKCCLKDVGPLMKGLLVGGENDTIRQLWGNISSFIIEKCNLIMGHLQC